MNKRSSFHFNIPRSKFSSSHAAALLAGLFEHPGIGERELVDRE
jgi:hypothetical protein